MVDGYIVGQGGSIGGMTTWVADWLVDWVAGWLKKKLFGLWVGGCVDICGALVEVGWDCFVGWSVGGSVSGWVGDPTDWAFGHVGGGR